MLIYLQDLLSIGPIVIISGRWGSRGDVIGGAANDDGDDAARLDANNRDADDDNEDQGNDTVRQLVRKKSGKTARQGDMEVLREMQRQRELNGEEALATATGVEEEHTGGIGQMDAIKWC
jgi:hypothetical protein